VQTGRPSAKYGVTDALVIGYGNDLRTDDGAGRWVAAQIEALKLPGVEVRSLSQLTPELSLEVAGREMVVFVDANVDAAEVTVQRVHAEPSGPKTMTHHGDPATLLALVPTVGALPLRAYVVSIPAANLEMGLELSAVTQAAASQAVGRIVALLAGRDL
jgi:hydrogenase maturation protease